MSRTWFWVIIISVLTLNYGVAEATDQNDATNAATSILQSIHGHQFEKLWNVQTSQWFKEKTTEDSFIANLSLGAQQVGAAQDSKLVDISYSRSDPATGFVGEIYACTYLTHIPWENSTNVWLFSKRTMENFDCPDCGGRRLRNETRSGTALGSMKLRSQILQSSMKKGRLVHIAASRPRVQWAVETRSGITRPPFRSEPGTL
jgi:hypothetical protein